MIYLIFMKIRQKYSEPGIPKIIHQTAPADKAKTVVGLNDLFNRTSKILEPGEGVYSMHHGTCTWCNSKF
jgi:hypothetical protein